MTLVYGESDDIAPGIAARASISDLIKQFQDRAPVDIAGKVCQVRSHQHGHCELVFWKIHWPEWEFVMLVEV